jgi:predicted site-specific integrase-resolvase
MVRELTREGRRAFSMGEFATMFGISRDTAQRLMLEGLLRTIKVGGRRLVLLAEIERIERDGLERATVAR